MIKEMKELGFPPEVGAIGGSAFGTKGDIAILNEGSDDTNDGKSKSKDTHSDSSNTDKEEDGQDDSNKDSDERATEGDREDDSEKDEDETEKDDEEEKVEEEEETEEDKEYSAVPAISDIKKKFPDFFKSFPEVRAAIFRDQKFSEVFSSPKEAIQASEQAATFLEMEADLLSGQPERLFTAIKKADSESYQKLIASLLPTIEKNDKDLYMKVASVPLKKAIRAAIIHGRKNDDKNLEYGAMHLHKWLFDSEDTSEKAEFESDAQPKSKIEKEYEDKLKAIDEREYNTFRSTVDTEFLSKIKIEFEKDLDPQGNLSTKMKGWMYNDLLAELDKQLGSDARYQNQMKSLWLGAKKAGYQGGFKAKIVNAVLARANQLVPAIKARLKKEALSKGSTSKSNGNGQEKKRTFTENSTRREVKIEKSDKGKSDLDIIRGM